MTPVQRIDRLSHRIEAAKRKLDLADELLRSGEKHGARLALVAARDQVTRSVQVLRTKGRSEFVRAQA